jgi:hypothetical protein
MKATRYLPFVGRLMIGLLIATAATADMMHFRIKGDVK